MTHVAQADAGVTAMFAVTQDERGGTGEQQIGDRRLRADLHYPRGCRGVGMTRMYPLTS
jgi:hypothetical protein